jgi:L-rhamnose mutarotase
MPLSISGCGRKQEALRATGWRNYSLFLRADGLLIGYVESDDLAAAQRAMDQTAVNARWQRDMARFFVGTDGKPADQAFEPLPEVFHLPDAE